MSKKKTSKPSKRRTAKQSSTKPIARCGLCGKTKNLTKTECCDNWICDDEHKYVMFSYARNSCSRNHRRYTLCGFHNAEGHPGNWKECPKCREQIETEMYVYYGTNEYNFETLPNPPKIRTNQVLRVRRGDHPCRWRLLDPWKRALVRALHGEDDAGRSVDGCSTVLRTRWMTEFLSTSAASRCAIYTRQSRTTDGDFSSCEAQFEACRQFILGSSD